MQLSEFVAAIYAVKKLNLRPRSLAQLLYTTRAIERCFGRPVLIAELSESLVLQFLRWRLQSCERKTVRQDRGNILTIWRAAHRWGHCPNPCVDVETIRVPKRQPHAWTIEEVEAVLAVCLSLPGSMRNLPVKRCDWWSSLILFLYASGSRVGAALELSPRDINLDTGLVRLASEHDKTWTESYVWLFPQCVEQIRKVHQPNAERLWAYPWNSRKIWLDLKQIFMAAGLPAERYQGFHSFRRTCATQVACNAGLEAARELLGHSSLQMTRAYVDGRQLPAKRPAVPELRIG